MRPLTFDPTVLRQHLRRHRIATLAELKRALGTSVDITVFRKLNYDPARIMDRISVSSCAA